MKICKRCIQPNSRPGLYFDDNRVCGACIWEEQKKTIDWDKREKELDGIVKWAKQTKKGNYDCAIGISGGKDSTKQALTARDRLGLHCLLVNGEPEGITDVGKHNIENLKNLGFDVITLRPNPKVTKKLVRRDFYKYLNPIKITEYSLYSSTYIIAGKFDIPLIIQGENPGLTLGTSLTGVGTNSDALRADELDTLKSGWREYLEVEGITENDLYFFHYDRKKLEQKGIKGIWIQYFLREWSPKANAEFSREHGFMYREKDFDPKSIGTYSPYFQLDSDMVQVNQLLKYVKFGFGQCMDHACYDIRDGLLTRDEAINLVKKYDGKCSEKYIKKFCDYIDISLEEFWNVSNRFRGTMWKMKDGDWYNTFWDEINKETPE